MTGLNVVVVLPTNAVTVGLARGATAAGNWTYDQASLTYDQAGYVYDGDEVVNEAPIVLPTNAVTVIVDGLN